MSVIHVTKDNFEELVLKSDKKVLLDFWATWCGPCQMIAPVLEEIAQEREDVTVAKIDVDKEMELAIKYGIVSIPTLIVMDQGQAVNKLIGFRPKADIEKLLD
ncbi:MAG: thioredoxin [Oscillospiraceae bacterium]|nr:thioredoxin [Oscillospiraceae bacterium]